MPAERRRPGQGARIPAQGDVEASSTWPPMQRQQDYLHIPIFNGKKYQQVKVQRKPGFAGWVRPKHEGAPEYESHQNLNRVLVCKDCREYPANLVSEDHDSDMVCADCGLVLDKIVSTESEWRSFANDNPGENGGDKSRVGGGENPLFGDSKLEFQTSIGSGGQSELNRALERAQRNVTGKDGKKVSSLSGGYRDIAALCAKGGYPDTTKEVAQQVYKVYRDEPGARKNLDQLSVLGTCLMLACRQTGFARSFKEMCAICGCKVKDLGRTFKVIEEIIKRHDAKIKEKQAMNIHVNNTIGAYNVNHNVTSAVDLVVRMTEALRLPMKCRLITEHIAAQEEKVLSCLAGRRPSTVAASALLMAIRFMKIDKTINEVAEVAKVSPHTLQKSYRLLCAHKTQLIDAKWVEDGTGDFSQVGKIDGKIDE